MKILKIAFIEDGDFKNSSLQVKMGKMTNDDLVIEIPKGMDGIMHGPDAKTNRELFETMLKEFNKYGSFGELKKIKRNGW